MIANYVGAALFIFGVILLLRAFGVIALTQRVAERLREALQQLSAPELDDDAKERAAQQASLRLLAIFGGIMMRTAAAAAFLVLIVWPLHAAGLVDFNGVLRAGLSIPFLVIMSLGAVLWVGFSVAKRP